MLTVRTVEVMVGSLGVKCLCDAFRIAWLSEDPTMSHFTSHKSCLHPNLCPTTEYSRYFTLLDERKTTQAEGCAQ